MTAEPPVTLCIVNYNGAEHLRKSLQAVRTQDWLFAELLLIDDASEDSSVEVAAALCPEAKTIRLASNSGPGAARNAGFRSAANELILFQDNDICLTNGTAMTLVRHLQDRPDVLLVTPRVVYAHDPETVQYDSADCHFLGLMATRNADVRAEQLGHEPHDTTSMVSACFLIDRGRWQGRDPFDGSFGFNLEDHDFGVRARLSGHSLRVEPRAVVHHGSGTPGLSWRPGQAAGENRLYYLTRNRWIVISKCYAKRTLAILFPVLLLFEVLQLGRYVGKGQFHVWWRAVRSYRRSLARIRAERKVVQSHRKLPDREVLRDAPLPLTGAMRDGAVAVYVLAAMGWLMRAYWRLVRRWL
jgi:GT2 family glycosyltransferase